MWSVHNDHEIETIRALRERYGKVRDTSDYGARICRDDFQFGAIGIHRAPCARTTGILDNPAAADRLAVGIRD